MAKKKSSPKRKQANTVAVRRNKAIKREVVSGNPIQINIENQQQAATVPSVHDASRVPFALSLVGFITGIPGIICSMACGAAVGSVSAEAGTGVLILILIFSVMPLGVGLFGGIKSRKTPGLGGILMLVAGGFEFFGVFLASNAVGWITALCFIIGGVMALSQRRSEV